MAKGGSRHRNVGGHSKKKGGSRGTREHEIFFVGPEFNDGLNLTVRDGSAWYKKLWTGDTLLLKETGRDEVIQKARVVGKWVALFSEIPEELLEHEHCPDCRTREGLLEHGMKPAYPDFTEQNEVSLIFFQLM